MLISWSYVAGILGSKTYGVAKKTNLIAVKVIGDDNTAAFSDVLTGLNWALSDIRSNNRPASAVINLSLGGPASSAMDNAVTSVSNQGVLVVVAAGNDNQPAANVSPARVPLALCVGSVQTNGARSSYSIALLPHGALQTPQSQPRVELPELHHMSLA
jgi:subtilisin family serine protease